LTSVRVHAVSHIHSPLAQLEAAHTYFECPHFIESRHGTLLLLLAILLRHYCSVTAYVDGPIEVSHPRTW
jgi:hypothetical protein